MIGTIRKHSGPLWVVIIILTVISFIWWGAAPSGVNRNGGNGGNLGTIYGKKITPQQFQSVLNEYRLFYLFHYGN